MFWGGRRAIPVFLASATLIPILALGWLGFRVIEQDRALANQRERERLEVAAGRLALAIERRLVDAEDRLAKGGSTPILYQPQAPEAGDPVDPALAAAEKLEFTQPHPERAAEAYRQLAADPKPGLRAAALVRLARVLRKQGEHAAAQDAYRLLLRLGSTPIDGQPAELVARQGLCRIWEETHAAENLRKEVMELARALYSGSWPIDRSTFHLYREMAVRWGAAEPPADAIAKTEAALALWREWSSGVLPPRGRRIVHETEPAVLALWTTSPGQPAFFLLTPASFQSSFGDLWKDQNLTLWLQDAVGQPFLGAPAPGGVTLTPAASRLPFLLGVAPLPAANRDGNVFSGRSFLLSGLLLTIVFTLAAAYGLYRATSREMELARQQADFVSAVSHEFRTPLTSMRHLTEMLATRGVPSEERRAYYYQLLAGETERLHRMMESLLSFGRIEAGAYSWRLERADPGELVRTIVDEFRDEEQLKDRDLTCEIEDRLPAIEADREALSRALWNLLENAVKYSPPSSPIRVFARRSGDSIHIGVEDHGHGIPPAEQAAIFQKFVRGAEAKRGGVRGVGIGLALVKRIAEAHGGSVELASKPGRGSTFTLVLPCHAS